MDKYKIIKVHNYGDGYIDVKVSNEDYDQLSQWRGWQLNKKGGYARRTVRKKGGGYTNQYMHRLIMNAPDGVEVDHINGDTCDNRRCNLRLCDRSTNLLNKRKASSKSTVGLVGVERKRDKFAARITIKGERTFIGTYETAEEAKDAYEKYKRMNVESYLQISEGHKKIIGEFDLG